MALSFSNKRYEDVGDAKILSDRTFYFVMALTLMFGFGVNALEVWLLAEYFAGWNVWVFFIVYLVMAIGGVCLNIFSRNPVLSFLGYCMVVLPVGAALSLTVPAYLFATVQSAFTVTLLLAAAFALMAVLWPNVFYSMWKVLAISLLVALIWQIVSLLTGIGRSTLVWVDWIVVLIFCCYVGFDVSLAKSRPKTLDNAVDSACGLYLDLINIFIRLLAIFGRND